MTSDDSGVAKSSTSFGWGKGGNVTSAGWQLTLCDPIWHVSSRSGVAIVRELLYTCYFTLLCTRWRFSEGILLWSIMLEGIMSWIRREGAWRSLRAHVTMG